MQIVQAIVGLAHNLGMEVVAEGIETEEELTTVRDFTCEFGQGYLISKPQPAELTCEFLTHPNRWQAGAELSA